MSRTAAGFADSNPERDAARPLDDAEAVRFVDELSADPWTYRGVPMLRALRVFVFMVLRSEVLVSERPRRIVQVRLWLWCLREAFRVGTFKGRGSLRRFGAPSEGERFLVVADHDNAGFFEMLLDIARALGDRAVLLTRDRTIFRRLTREGHRVVSAEALSASVFLRPRHLKAAWRAIKAPHIARQPLVFRAQVWVAALRTAKAVDAYWEVLDPATVRGVIALCDTHTHEFVLVSVANAKGIPTATLQHGLVGPLLVPVVSRWIFVWGESSKAQLMDLGVPEAKIVVAGRPFLDTALRSAAEDPAGNRRSFCAAHGLDEQRPVVAYFATNWSPELNRQLFDCFASACDLPIAAFVKLKSNATPRQLDAYRGWLTRHASTRALPLVTNEMPWRCFGAADVVVTCHSTVGAEALAFGAVVILLDLSPEIRLRETMPHFDDCIIAKTAGELREVLRRICEEDGYMARLKEAARLAASRHLLNSADRDASRFIADFVRSATAA